MGRLKEGFSEWRSSAVPTLFLGVSLIGDGGWIGIKNWYQEKVIENWAGDFYSFLEN